MAKPSRAQKLHLTMCIPLLGHARPCFSALAHALTLFMLARASGGVPHLPEHNPALPIDAHHSAAVAAANKARQNGVGNLTVRVRRRLEPGDDPEIRHMRAQSWMSFLHRKLRGQRSCESSCKSSVDGRSSLLPNVLIVGDSVSMYEMGYLSYVKKLLDGVARIQMMGSFGDGACGTSFGALACIDTWLDGGGWDVISFNWGLHDICPQLYGKVTPEEYIANLHELYRKMKQGLTAGGSVVFQSTTPVPPDSNRNITDVYAINMLAQSLFANYTPPVPVSPLFDMVVTECQSNVSTLTYPFTSDCPQLQYSDNVHFTEEGRSFTGQVVANSILKVLKSQKKAKPDYELAAWGRRRRASG